MNPPERLVFLLALAPHVKPQLLDVFFEANDALRRGYTEFGGVKGQLHNGFLPTLETALFEVPQVVCYRGSAISYAIARKMVQVKYISLVNLILDQAFLTELIQQELNLQRLQEELQRCLNPEQASYFHNHYQKLKTVLGGPGASQKAADIITEEAQHG